MGRAKIGIAVGSVLVITALLVYGCNNIHIQKKESAGVSTQAVQSQKTGIVLEGNDSTYNNSALVTENTKIASSDIGLTNDNSGADLSSQSTTQTVDSTLSDQGLQGNNNTANSGLTLSEVQIPELDSAEQSSVGNVVDKKAYLENNGQIIYVVKIEVPMGVSSVVVDYYCTNSTFSILEIGDELVVIYQSVKNGTGYVIKSVNRA